jgi:osomolarity two-component system sensor histidine kinase SLN1
MDSGKFESVAKPYHFHAVIKSLLVPLKLAADARGLALITNVDSAIDHAARTATYQAQGKDEAFINRALAEEEEDGLVVGDEMRLRQILTNLTRYVP